MPNGISYNYLKDAGVMINIPDNYREVVFTKEENVDLNDFPKNVFFNPIRIVINFSLLARKEDPSSKICIPAKIFVYIEQGDLRIGKTIDDLKLADWDGSDWNILVLNLERWVFPSPISFNGKNYIGYIKADACIPGDPPIALGE